VRNTPNRRVRANTTSPTTVISWYKAGIAADLGVAVGEVGSDPGQGDQSDHHRREDQRPMAEALIIGILRSGAKIGQSIEEAHD
jgi:hypothetical protein